MNPFASVGLDVDASTTYRAVLERPGLNAVQYAEAVGLHPDQVRAAIVRLERLGLIHTDADAVRARRPHADVARAVHTQLERLDQQRADLERLQQAIGRYRELHGDDAPGHDDLAATSVKDFPRVVDELARRTSGPVRIAHPDVSVNSPESLPALSQTLAEGRRIRGLYDAESVQTRSLEISAWAAAGEEQRLAGSIPTEFVVFGDECVLVSAGWGGLQQVCVLRDAAVVRSFITLFDRMWETAIGVEGNVDTQSDQLVSLLQEGLRDDEIAKVMGISSRLVRKRVDALMQECGAQTRFGLALALAERGMLSSLRDEDESGWSNR